ncbi:MAG: flagellar biosynthesis protein FlhF [Lachnospiraceae bacterium]|nr:flagellar biosynthesis protein FlhF [Lachnospiraceae bacterium]
MIIKKFQGKTESEAVEAAKKELGNNLVIMNSKSTKRKGMFGFLLPEIFEVTVALEEESDKNIQVKPESGRDSGSPAAVIPLASSEPYPVSRLTREDSEEEKRDSKILKEKLDNLHQLLEQQLQKPEEDKVIEEEENTSELLRFMKLIYNTLLDNEVNEKYANQIIDEIERSAKPNLPFDYALANIYQKMILKFGDAEGITPSKRGPKMVFFIGPTGVGKTTTIAKLASRYVLIEKKKVAMITSDTYRIAAAEQLKTYAGILEVPFKVVYSPEEIEQTLKEFTNYDYIFVDTSGHSYQNEEQKQGMVDVVHSVDGKAEKDVFLVLSATTKYRDLLKIVDAYSPLVEYKLIFTKLDETAGLGNLLNIRLYTGAALSYVTYGQNVPDDMEEFNPQKTVKQLLSGKM